MIDNFNSIMTGWKINNYDNNKANILAKVAIKEHELEIERLQKELSLYLRYYQLEDDQEERNRIYQYREKLKDNLSENQIEIEKLIHFMAQLSVDSAEPNTIHPIVWNGTQADLARIFNDLKDSGIINTTGRDFSKHFLTKQGEPMPEDFTESKGYKQPEYSKNGTISGLQNTIRGMKPESGE